MNMFFKNFKPYDTHTHTSNPTMFAEAKTILAKLTFSKIFIVKKLKCPHLGHLFNKTKATIIQ